MGSEGGSGNGTWRWIDSIDSEKVSKIYLDQGQDCVYSRR